MTTAKGHNGQVTLEDGWLTIARKGIFAKVNHGLKGDKRVPVASITSVQFKKANALTSGYIQFGMMGGTESRAGLVQAGTDENTVIFTKSQAPVFEALRDEVEAAIAARHAPPAPVAQPSDLGDELRKLAALRDEGLLSEEEFQGQRSRLLR